MPQFDVKGYKERLAVSQSCDTCEKVPSPKIDENTRYIFISYSHKDYKQVYIDLAELYNSDIPFWYDNGLPAGKNWDDVVRQKMRDPNCAGVIFYLSENLFLSRSIQTEIMIACGENGDESLHQTKLSYFSVNLTDQCPSRLLKHTYPYKEFADSEDEMASQLKWVQTLTSAFPDKATYLPFHNPHHTADLVQQIDVVFGVNPNYNPYHFGDAFFRSGTGIIEFKNGAIYNGSFLDGVFFGDGILSFPDGAVFDCQWENGKRNGHGTATYPEGATYVGEWKDDLFHGHGVYSFPDGTVFDCQWENGKRNGHGTATYPDGSVYCGEWLDDDWVEGSFTRGSDGHRFVGGWGKNGSCGFGTYIYPDGTSRCGIWDGETLLEGKGVIQYSDGSVYDGQIKNNLRHGYGTYTLVDGTVQTGQFDNDIFINPTQ